MARSPSGTLPAAARKRSHRKAGKGKAKPAARAAPKSRPVGRPASITPQLAEVILDRLAYQSVEQVFADPKMPERQTFYNHCKRDPTFFDASARARALRSLVEMDEAERSLVDAKPSDIPVIRERMQHARWKVSRMLAKYYGERLALSAPGGGPIQIQRIEMVIVDAGDGDSGTSAPD
jgi:hypothetical protein